MITFSYLSHCASFLDKYIDDVKMSNIWTLESNLIILMLIFHFFALFGYLLNMIKHDYSDINFSKIDLILLFQNYS